MFLTTVFSYCDRIKNGRQYSHILKHAESEHKELTEEVCREFVGLPPGDDGIVGEAVDAILCYMDIIHKANPDLSEEEFLAIVVRKLNKWETGCQSGKYDGRLKKGEI